jgi:hypothetical protein
MKAKPKYDTPQLQIYCRMESDPNTGKPYIAEFWGKVHKGGRRIEPKEPTQQPRLLSKCERPN